MNSFPPRVFLAAAMFFYGSCAFAAPPTLTPINPASYSAEATPGVTRDFSVLYTDVDGDPPQTVDLNLETPGGTVVEHAALPPGNPTQGIPIAWTYTPEHSGTYKFYFDAVSSTGQTTRLPINPSQPYEFSSVSPLTKLMIFLVGLLFCLIALPLIAYSASRSLNRGGDPSSAARGALILGILAALGLYIAIYATDYGFLGDSIAVIAVIALVALLFSRRRAV